MSKKSILLIILTIDIICIIIALSLGETPEQYFGERSFITYLSFLQLLVISGLAWKIFNKRKSNSKQKIWKSPFFIWLLIAIAFIFLSLDEVFKIHENIDFLIHMIFRIQETALTDRIDDIIVGFYGVLGLMLIYFYREEFVKYKRVFPFFVVGFILMFLMVLLDILTNRKDILQIVISNPYFVNTLHSWLSATEDMLKIIAEAVFLGGFSYCLEIARELSNA